MSFLEEIEYPKNCLINSVIPKKDFYEAGFKNSDKNLFTNNVKQIKWVYSLKETNIQIPPYKDDEKEYLETEIFTLKLKKDNKIERVCELIHRFIPYPLLIVLYYKDKIMLSVANKRDSKIDKDAIKLTDIRYTDWIDEEIPNKFAQELFDNLKFENLKKDDFFTLYNDIVSKIILYNGSRHAGKEVTKPVNEVKEINDKIYYLTKEINNKKYEIEDETQFNRQVELNKEIKGLKDQIKELKEELVS